MDQPLCLGDHLGNQFEIVLRDVRPHDSSLSLEECIDKAVSGVQRSGFVNYYGQQRFGLEDATVNAWNVGLAMLKEQHVSEGCTVAQCDSESVVCILYRTYVRRFINLCTYVST